MDQKHALYIISIDVLAAAVEALPDDGVDLSDGVDPDESSSGRALAQIVARHPFFGGLGVIPDEHGDPLLVGPDGNLMDARPTLMHLFGDDGHGFPVEDIFSPAWAGASDRELRKSVGTHASGKQLALARLRLARERVSAVPEASCVEQ